MKRWIRRGVDGVLSAESTAHPVLRGVAGAIRWLRTLARPARDRRLRSERMTRLVYAGAHFQGSTFTLPDRFPALFACCRLEFGAEGSPRILSFGCSIGEEVLTLAGYLPKARIVGVDLNRWCLRQCRRKAGRNGNLTFLHARPAEFQAARGFDAIFCLAVLQRGENAEIEGTVLKTGLVGSEGPALCAQAHRMGHTALQQGTGQAGASGPRGVENWRAAAERIARFGQADTQHAACFRDVKTVRDVHFAVAAVEDGGRAAGDGSLLQGFDDVESAHQRAFGPAKKVSPRVVEIGLRRGPTRPAAKRQARRRRPCSTAFRLRCRSRAAPWS